MHYRQQKKPFLQRSLVGLVCLFIGALHAEELTESPVTGGYVARAVFTSGIENREPVDQLESVGSEHDSIYFFTELRDLQGQTIKHRWMFNGKFMSEHPFKVGGPRWRVYSTKMLYPWISGKWTALVVDESGSPLHTSTFMRDVETE